MTTTLNTTILLRRAAFEDSCILALGEPGYHITTKELKIGDGTTAWKDLPFANKEQIDALIKVVDDKVAALGDTYATDEEVRIIKEALQEAINSKVAQSDYDTYTGARQLTDTQINAEFAKYTTTTAQQAIDAEQDRRLGLIEAELDTHGDIVTHNVAEFATAEQGAKADAAAVKADVDAALGERYTKTEADAKFETIANVDLVRADITNITKEGGLIATAKQGAIDAAKTETQTQITTFKTEVTDVLDERIEDVETQLANVSNVMDFVGAGANLPAAEDSNKGDVFVINEGENAGKEYVFDGTTWVEFGYATGNENAIANLKDRMDGVEDRLDAIEPKVAGWDETKTTVDTNKVTWDLAGTAVQSATFETFKTENTKAIGDAEAVAKGYTDTELADFNTETVAPIAARVKAIEDAPYATTGNVATAKQEAIEAAAKDAADKDAAVLAEAQKYADDNDANTTYTVEATTNALEFTVTPSEGEAQTVKLVAPTVDVGVTKVTAGKQIIVTPEDGTGAVTVSHETIVDETGTEVTGVIKDIAHDSTTDPSFITSLSVTNGHVTGATVQNLKSVLENMIFVLDGGESASTLVIG